MNLEDLRSAQADERRADSLQPLPDDFYRNVATYIEGLREERENAAGRSDDPFGSEEVRMLTDEIETAEEVAEAIYERRVGKVVKRASLAAAGMPADRDGLTAEERELFEDLVAQIEAHREEVLASFGGDADLDHGAVTGGAGRQRPPGDEDAPQAPPDRPASDEARAVLDDEEGSELDAGAAMGEGVDEADDGDRSTDPEADGGASAGAGLGSGGDAGDSAGSTEDRTTVRITTDVGEVFGVDEHTYELAEEDVVTLPTANAEPLIDRDAAQRLE